MQKLGTTLIYGYSFFMSCSMHSKLCFPRVQYEACLFHTFPVTVLGNSRCVILHLYKIQW